MAARLGRLNMSTDSVFAAASLLPIIFGCLVQEPKPNRGKSQYHESLSIYAKMSYKLI